jgi:protein O-GlcNAc transferase
MDMKKRQAAARRRVRPLGSPKAQPAQSDETSQQGPPAFLVQALEHVQAGRLETAVDLLKAQIPRDPLAAHSNLGSIYLLENRFEDAEEALQKAFHLSQGSTGIAIGLAHAMASQQRVEGAVDVLLACLKLQHQSPSIRALTDVLIEYQAQEAALAELKSLHERLPDNLEIQFERAVMLKNTGYTQEAEEVLWSIQEKQAHVVVYDELARLYRGTQRPGKAVACLQQAVALNPDQIEFSHDLGNAYIQAGLVEQGLDVLKQALEKWPEDSTLRSDFIEQSHYLPGATPEALFDAYKQWSRRHAPASMDDMSHENQPDLDRVLRIGYLSPDFGQHRVSSFLEPLLEAHHRDRVQVYGYGPVLNVDEVTERIKGKFDHYCDIVTLDDQAVAQQIRQDRIDILVDLAGHTSGNRLGIMAAKPAPIQVTYLGHSGTTGMPQIDYRFTDANAESERSRECSTESLVDLPQGFLCFRPPENAPDVTDAPIVKNGYVTFGSFNHQAKINKNMIALWSRILLNIPDARFLLKLCVGDDEAVKAAYLECFESYGIPADRIELHTLGTHEDHLACLGSVDIALDSFPCNGTTSTCETLWMGVPVITLKGDLHRSRMGYSLLSQLSMEFLALDTTDQYVTMACALASKPEAISQMRDSMRLRMKASTLCQGDVLAQNMENAYQHMWHQWCHKTLSPVG